MPKQRFCQQGQAVCGCKKLTTPSRQSVGRLTSIFRNKRPSTLSLRWCHKRQLYLV